MEVAEVAEAAEAVVEEEVKSECDRTVGNY